LINPIFVEKNLYKEIAKLINVIEENTRKWKDNPFSLVGRINIIKMDIILIGITESIKSPLKY
jgi:hypothetical protein